MNIHVGRCLPGIACLLGCLLNAAAIAGPERVAFPKDYATWERYAVVDRYDNKQYRELFAKPEVVKTVRAGGAIPDGTVIALAVHSAAVDANGDPIKDANGRFVKGKLTGITVMEKRAGWGAVYDPDIRNGDWEYAVFLPDGTPNATANANSQTCLACHKPHVEQDYVISFASLANRTAQTTPKRKAAAGDVRISSFAFGPSSLQVRRGQSIVWINKDDSPHQILVQGQHMKTALVFKDQSASLTFSRPGTFTYACALHPAMKGSIEVTD